MSTMTATPPPAAAGDTHWIAYVADDTFYCPTCCPPGDYNEHGALLLPVRPCDYVAPKPHYKSHCDVCHCQLVTTDMH